jgi:hypothetical protein
MPQNIPIETALGRLDGRDCIYLDGFAFEDGTGTLVLDGSINGNLCSNRQPGRFVPYTLRFRGVLARYTRLRPNPYMASTVNSRTPNGERCLLLVKHLARLPD